MTEEELQKIADDAPIIVSGYAFTPDANGHIRVLNLYKTDEACVLDVDGNMIATTANVADIEEVPDSVSAIKGVLLYRR